MNGARRDRVIQILPLGPVPRAELVAASTTISALFDVACEILPAVAPPSSAYRAARRQYDADALLDFLFDRLAVDVVRLVSLTEADLFAEGRNFVFGYAHMRDRVAVFSTVRLREQFWGRPDDPALFRARVDKALAHELGHTFHVPHCPVACCVMHQVEFLWQLDELEQTYCPSCHERVHATAGAGVDAPQALFELGGSYMRRRRFARAAAMYAAAAERAPDNPNYHNDHGVALLAAGERAGAARAFERAIRAAPQAPHAYYNLGILSRERGDAHAADLFFSEAMRRDDDPREAARYLGMLHQDYFGDLDSARRYYERYRALGGDEPEVVRRMAALGVADRTADTSSRPGLLDLVAESPLPV